MVGSVAGAGGVRGEFKEEKIMQQQIPGVPLGTKIKSLHLEGLRPGLAYVQLEPDNIYGVLDLASVQISAGMERLPSDWFRMPKIGEWFVHCLSLLPVFCDTKWLAATSDLRRIIVQPVKPKMRRVLVVEIENPTTEEVSLVGARGWLSGWKERPA